MKVLQHTVRINTLFCPKMCKKNPTVDINFILVQTHTDESEFPHAHTGSCTQTLKQTHAQITPRLTELLSMIEIKPDATFYLSVHH